MSDIKTLEDWVALPSAAEQMGMTRQGLHFRVNQGLVPGDSVRKVAIGSKIVVLIHQRYIDNGEGSE